MAQVLATRIAAHAPVPQWLQQVRATLLAGRACVLITVVRTQGSTPRETGAHLWVDADSVGGSIGGGHLEWVATAQARRMLETGEPAALWRRYPLGPSLGQCCGGAVTLLFERLGQTDLAWLDEAIRIICVAGVARRVTRVDASQHTTRVYAPGAEGREAPCARWDEQALRWEERMSARALPVVVCGAGHVGKEIIHLLGRLPVTVHWLDARDDQWPRQVPDNVICVQGDDQDVPDMPPGAAWLVLTHDHALDLAIVEAVLRHQSFVFLGMIGSRTKAARFRSQLSRRLSPAQAERLVCPMGLINTASKLPAVIAVSVVAQLLPLMDSPAD